ncbi:hypothetical protein F4806DRAFT_495527 [Annulohypoxylon nitens]|nr:hypothetical protein F4806DRAFT_495527 [Annulohypoxylon nitens]
MPISGWRLHVVIACLFMGSFLIAIDTNIINVAIPKISSDFKAPQGVAWYGTAYLLKYSFPAYLRHHSDKYRIKILQALVPGLRKGAKVVVNDICVPEPEQVGMAADRGLRQMDISMKAFNNGRERDYATWSMLFTAADPDFEFLGITLPEGARVAIIQAVWTGEGN